MSKSKKIKEEPMPIVESVPTVDFNVWFAMREKKIPAQHLREIIWADFQGRGLSKKETVVAYDAALAEYGVKLK
jgi:hypothetical protein